MANIRIKDLSTTASTTASDDFFGVDGATNGTRKLNAYSPTFGGNLTVSGSATLSSSVKMGSGAVVALGAQAVVVDAGSEMRLQLNSTDRPGIYFTAAGSNLATMRVNSTAFELLTTSGTPLSINQSTLATTLGGNLTVSGTGVSSVAGNLLVGTTTDGGQKLQVVGQSSTGFISATDYSNGDAGQFIARGARGTAASPLAQNASDSTGLVRMYGYDGSSFIENARIHAQAVGTIATNRVGGVLSFWTHPDSTSAIAEAMRITQSQNLLVGTTTDSGNGKLQLATHITSAGGIGFGTDLSLYRGATGLFAFNDTSGAADTRLFLYNSGTLRGAVEAYGLASAVYIGAASAGWSTYVTSGNQAIALTLDTSQRAQFAGNLGLGAGPLSYMGIRNSLSLTASSGVAYVYQSGGTLTTSANNDQIFGMSIDNGYSNTGSYTNISAGHLQINAQSFSGISFGYGIRIGNITGATNNYAIRTGSGIVSFEDTTASTATNSGALRVSGGVGVAGAINVGTFYGMVDGVTAPSATSGYAKIYVDTADGDLKVIFGDGTIKTIATDS